MTRILNYFTLLHIYLSTYKSSRILEVRMRLSYSLTEKGEIHKPLDKKKHHNNFLKEAKKQQDNLMTYFTVQCRKIYKQHLNINLPNVNKETITKFQYANMLLLQTCIKQNKKKIKTQFYNIFYFILITFKY